MPNSQVDTAVREDADTLRLTGPIGGLPPDVQVRLELKVTQGTGFVAVADQIVSGQMMSGQEPSAFEVRATRTRPGELDPNAPLRVTGLLASRNQRAGTEDEAVLFRWAEVLDPEPAGGASATAGSTSAGWRRRLQPA